MDEKRLQEIERNIASDQKEYWIGDCVVDVVYELVAEVRRLRSLADSPETSITMPDIDGRRRAVKLQSFPEGAEPHPDVAKF